MEKSLLHRETRTRKRWAIISSFSLVISVVFLILCELGTTSSSRLPNVYFIKLDLSNIIPTSVPNYSLINTIAQTLGLHDYYQVGLWNYCAANNGEGIVECSKPKTLFWFNPIAVIQSELLSGATIAFPTEIQNVLHILKTASQWMFGLFLTAVVLDFVMIFITPLALYSKLLSLPIAIFSFLSALVTTVAAILGTVIFVIFRNAARAQTNLNIGANIGSEMFAFMWIAAGFSLFSFLIQMSLLCCCRSRRKAKKEWRKRHANSVNGSDKEKDDASPQRSSMT
ncbi:uncharacterized protein PV09_03689 [Verruconis gallopava]|uniref:Uncharacterized protein n=1 Tax=Verruconis gallopava TaxID=253628 RepID=A0A0D2ADR2_9PEZI|nr:uncharacterized protein PV09_03689 [Verruconis gallopava]KIW05138.1 hypothetical protein PV09_03689 [Verruconis gallopava]